MTKTVIIGAAGRMGKMLVRCVQASEDMTLAGAVEFESHPDVNKDVGAVAGCAETGVRIVPDLESVLSAADVAIDFTLHSAVAANATTAARLETPLVIGTTGLNEEETSTVKDAAGEIPIVWAPNMSLGVNVLFETVRSASAALGLDYAVQIDETHHVHKKDAPSGTALRLGEKVAEGRRQDFDDARLHDPEGAQGEHYPPESIAIRSYRRGEVVGDHTVRFISDAETLEFTHHAWSRDAFAMGALKAAQWVLGREPGLYTMRDVLGL